MKENIFGVDDTWREDSKERYYATLFFVGLILVFFIGMLIYGIITGAFK